MRKVLLIGVACAALSQALIATAAEPELRICTGAEGGFYEKLGNAFSSKYSKATGYPSEVINTTGSVDSAQKLKDGDCDVAILQADAVVSQAMPADIKVTDAHTEAVYWLYGPSGIEKFDAMSDKGTAKKFAFAAVKGSGAEVTVRNWIRSDKDYEGARVVLFDDWYTAAEAVAQGFVQGTESAGQRIEIAGMLYIGRPGTLPSDIVETFGKRLKIGQVKDGSFESALDANKNPLYVTCSIADTQRSGLDKSGWGEPTTYCMRAQVVYNLAFIKSLDAAAAKKVNRELSRAVNDTVKVVQ
jgi:hypothetical protein